MNDKCCFCNKDKCGSFTKLRIPIDGLFSKNDLVNDVEHHLSIIKTEKKSFSINLLTEKGLIGNRIGKEFQDGDRICAKHHYKMRIYWRVPLKCQHQTILDNQREHCKLFHTIYLCTFPVNITESFQ